MADDGAERQFLQSQALTAGTASGNEGADGSDSDDYDPSATVQDQFSASLADSNQNNSPEFSSLVTSSASDSAQKSHIPGPFSEGPPHNSVAYPSTTPPRPESKNSAPAPEMDGLGGVVPGDDDGGEAEYEPPAALSDHVQDSISPSEIVTPTENVNEAPFHVSQEQTVSDKITSNVSTSSFNPVSHIDIPSQNDGSSKTIQNESKLPARSISQSASGSIPTTPTVPTPSRGRLPHDRVGILEDRIQADPRGDVEAWLELMNEHRSRNKIDNAREVYERFFKVFPGAVEQWVAYANMESENNELYRLEQIFNKTLLTIPNVQLWSVYLDYVRRRNNLTTDAAGQARRIISSAYDFALQNIGLDKDAGNIWVDHIDFIRSGPGNIGGSGWQDQQKMDSLRKAYQRAICVPTQAVNTLWKEYDQFEMGLNKLTGRKFLQERSPLYMTARSSYTELQNITKGLVRTSLPKLPPAPGFEGDIEFSTQLEIWKRWIKWEKDDPLVLKEEDVASYRARVLHVYKHALLALRFMPEIWFDAADFCLQNGLENEGNEFLKQGVDANPESCLLAFKRADQLEIATESEQDPIKRGAKVREPYDRVLDALYELIAKVRTQESQDISRVEERFANGTTSHPVQRNNEDDEDDEVDGSQAKEAAKSKELEAVKNDYAGRIAFLSKTVSFSWIALMRAMRRIQGKGKPGEIAGSRQIFADARKRGRITSDVYIASALLEYHCYKDPAATKIFERGAKLFPEDEVFALEYLKHLIDINDITNARAVFETTVRRLASKPDNATKAKPIFSFMHEYESRYGDLVQIISLESRMRELYPEDPTLHQFSHRYSSPTFDPTSAQHILSPTQTKPKASGAVQEPSPRHHSPSPRRLPASTNSPKRPFAVDDFDDDYNRPRKFIRAESPLKGAAGRRLDHQKRAHHHHQPNGSGAAHGAQAQPPPLPRDVMFLLSIIPPASSYDATRFSPAKMVNLLRQVDIPSNISQVRPPGGMSQTPMVGNPLYSGYRPNV